MSAAESPAEVAVRAARHSLVVGGVAHPPGSTVLLPAEEAADLAARGIVEPAEAAAAAPAAPPAMVSQAGLGPRITRG